MNRYEVDPDEYLPAEGSEERELMDIVHLGETARQFLQSELALFIKNSAEAKLIAAQKALCDVDPADQKEIGRLQNVIKRFDHYEDSLRELVTAGDSAYQLYLARQTQTEE